MGTYDYAPIAAKVDAALIKYGREITLTKYSETPADATKPWNGRDPSGDTTLTVNALQLLPNAVRIFGLSALGESSRLEGMLNVLDYVYIAYIGTAEISDFTYVTDGGVDYIIEATQELKPEDVNLLAYIGVRR
jgi:hypothetical protein